MTVKIKGAKRSGAGRPKVYSPEVQAKADTYLEKNTRVIPSATGLAVFLGIARSTIYKWAEIEPKFSDTLDEILSNQELDALDGGLNGDFNPAISKLVLANHGYREKQESEITIKDKDPAKRKSRIEELLSKAKG